MGIRGRRVGVNPGTGSSRAGGRSLEPLELPGVGASDDQTDELHCLAEVGERLAVARNPIDVLHPHLRAGSEAEYEPTDRPDRRSRSISVIAVSKGLRVWAMAIPLPSCTRSVTAAQCPRAMNGAL
jgi:hypothetical protein